MVRARPLLRGRSHGVSVPEGLFPTFSVSIPTSLEYVRPVRKMLEGLLGGEGWSEDDVADAGLVATEVIQNAVEHGSRGDGAEAVEVQCVLGPGVLEIAVHDPGSGKGPRALLARDVVTPPPIDSSRGRGLYLVNRMSKTMERGIGPDGGSVVRVRLIGPTPTPGA
jgi:serine/threonine-protein kinase RsbW